MTRTSMAPWQVLPRYGGLCGDGLQHAETVLAVPGSDYLSMQR